jgi:hypothetical protein
MYPILIDMGCIPTLLACLSHENTDIAADTLELFMELTGAGDVEICRNVVGYILCVDFKSPRNSASVWMTQCTG